MPIIQPGSTVLVTGANSFIGIWVVRNLLEKGYRARGVVRSEHKADYIRELFSEYGDKFEMVVVEDITEEGAFDEAVKGVDAIEHTASPVIMDADDPQILIKPAVKGTIGILRSALKSGSALKRIVITSSIAAIQLQNETPRPLTFSETQWNDAAVALVDKLGWNAPGISKYEASKTLAEKAAWAFVKEHKDQIKWDLVCINPSFVYGPCLHDVPTPDDLNFTCWEWYMARCWVDVRDVAEAHVLSLETPEAGGERIIICAESWFTHSFPVDIASRLSPPPNSWTRSRGAPRASISHMIKYDTSKAARIFGIKYRNMEEITRDSLADFERRGW
ncbi:hypothetical protein BD779DRAFT_1663913 [Infundibulicybe gibba]|nr:hypothetical protein BD779DRAFT_1663913 [Infundibulicybe gibba]